MSRKQLTNTTTLSYQLEQFLRAKQAAGKSPNTLRLYRFDNEFLIEFLRDEGAETIDQLTADHLRGFFIMLAETGHNHGGVHGYFRCVRVFLRWVWEELEIDRRNPISRVEMRTPTVKAKPGISVDTIRSLVDACRTDMQHRDKVLLQSLLATGARASEFINLNVGDVDFSTPSANVHIWYGKGDESRTVHLGGKGKRELLRYLRERKAAGDRVENARPLLATDTYERFTVSGLREVIRRRSADAGLPMPGLHDFRRGCGIMLLKNKMNLEYIRRYLGHKSIEVTKRYLGVDDPEIEEAYRSASPVDNIRW